MRGSALKPRQVLALAAACLVVVAATARADEPTDQGTRPAAAVVVAPR